MRSRGENQLKTWNITKINSIFTDMVYSNWYLNKKFKTVADSIITFLLLIGFAYQYLFFWKRNQMEKLGYNYPLFNSGFKMLSDFNLRIDRDKILKSKYRKKLTAIKIIFFILFLCFVVYHFLDK